MTNEEYLSILNSMKEGFQVVDQDLRYVFLNKSAEEHSRMLPGSLIGRKMTECYPGIEKTKLFELIIDTLERKNHNEFDNEFTYPNGEKGWFRISIQPSDNQIFIISTDITEIIKKNKELEQFAYITSHDLQEPLRTIMSLSQLMSSTYKGRLDEKADKYLRYIDETSQRMSDLIKGLLDYSRIGSERELTNIDCNELLNAISDDLQENIRESKAQIEVGELPEIRGYETELRMLFQNLISNALKFQKKDNKPRVTIDARKEMGGWEFACTDNGIGIAPENRERIFDIFQRLNKKTRYKGTGIGLAHCRKIVDLHGGKIRVESELGQGSTFYVFLPAQQ